ncbi:MAG: hypothetical protein HY454_03020, partial [Parcubacteria group bacterium]|nr:hypothetical protein [Parcubacteria group bacterium]
QQFTHSHCIKNAACGVRKAAYVKPTKVATKSYRNSQKECLKNGVLASLPPEAKQSLNSAEMEKKFSILHRTLTTSNPAMSYSSQSQRSRKSFRCGERNSMSTVLISLRNARASTEGVRESGSLISFLVFI